MGKVEVFSPDTWVQVPSPLLVRLTSWHNSEIFSLIFTTEIIYSYLSGLDHGLNLFIVRYSHHLQEIFKVDIFLNYVVTLHSPVLVSESGKHWLLLLIK